MRRVEREAEGLDLGAEFELLAVVCVHVRGEVGAAAGFVEAGGAYDDKLLRLAEALRMDRGLAADHADRGELRDLIRNGHQVRHRAERFGFERGIKAGHQDALAEGDQFDSERDHVGGEELHLVDADDFDVGELRIELRAEVFDVGDGRGLVGLRAVRGDRAAVVAEIDVGLEAGDALAGDARSLKAADQLFALARKHGADNDFEDAGRGDGVRGGHGIR